MSDPTSKEMTFLEHFEELRRRVMVVLIALVVTTGLSMTFAQRLLVLLAYPIGGLEKLQAIEVTETIGVFMKVALLAGVLFAMPVIVYELLGFILPGLHPNEKKWVAMAVPSATLLFAMGAYFSYAVMLPPSIRFLTTFMQIETAPRLSNYMNFVLNLVFWVGVSFESPLLIFVLAKLHIVTGRMLLRGWRIAVVVIAILAAVITPTVDPVNMIILMIPLLALYMVSVVLAFLAA